MMLLTVLVLLPLSKFSSAFQWRSEEVIYVTGCVESKVTVPWHYGTQEGETIDTIYWSRGDQTAVASLSLYQGRFAAPGPIRDRVMTSPEHNAGLTFDPARLLDNGYYQVQVTVRNKSADVKIQVEKVTGEVDKRMFNASALVVVAELPAIVNDSVHVEEMTSWESCSSPWQVTLSRGLFTNRGYPPVDVVWTDPAGQILTSSRFQGGVFYLDLPLRSLPGNYTSHVTFQPPTRQCLPPDSPLLRNLEVHVHATRTDACGEGAKENNEERREDFDDLIQNVTNLQQSVEVLQERFETAEDVSLQKLLVKMLEQHDEQLSSIKAAFSAMESRFSQETDDIKQKLNESQSQNDELKVKLNEAGHNAVVTSVQRIQEDCERLVETVNSLSSRMNSSEQDFTKDIATLKDRVTDFERSLVQCPRGWVEFDHTCYLLNSDPSTFEQAQVKCSSLGTTMAWVNSDMENRFINDLNKAAGLWIGLHDLNRDGVWTWSNSGSDVSGSGFKAWGSGQPQINHEYCAVLMGWYQWHDYPCNSTFRSVCKGRPSDMTTPLLTNEMEALASRGTNLERKHVCPETWVQHSGACYIFHKLPVTWQAAQGTCRTANADLVNIHNDIEKNLVVSLVSSGVSFVWIGLTHNLQESVESLFGNYTDWEHAEINTEDLGEVCDELIVSTGQWNEVPCTLLRAFVCKTVF